MINWTDLSSQLTTPVQVTDVNLWLQQCIKPFDAASLSDLTLSLGGVTNYQLFEQSSGLCMQTASCAFTNCATGPFRDTYQPFSSTATPFYQSEQTELYDSFYGAGVYPVLPDEDIVEAASLSEDSQLPAAVVHPEHPGDVSAAVRFAADNGLKVSVKTSGHNWNGSSTRKGTLLLNLSKLRKFSLPESLSDGIFECDAGAGDGQDGIVVAEPSTTGTYPADSVAAACKVALARDKPAIMRAGGGQIVDEGLRTVEEWNSDPSRLPLHTMIGSAGTVSLAGGWLASGGLGGSLGMRMYGIGVDQVLYAEMVLPDGQFVRFGPSTWTPAEGNQLYPQTTSVEGYCIGDDTADLSDESTWSWVDCSDRYDFDDLWFAIRGGSGGSFGVITSIYYQLHHKPGTLQSVNWSEPIVPILMDPSISDEAKGTAIREILGFVFNFLYNSERVGVEAEVSNACSAPDSGPLQCYNGAGQAFVNAWNECFSVLETANVLGGITVPPIRFDENSSYFASNTAPSFNGRIPDSPFGHIMFTNVNPMVIPIDVLKNKFEAFMDIYVPCHIQFYATILSGSTSSEGLCSQPYLYGGDVQFASDGTDAYPPHRRNGAFHFYALSEDIREQIKRLIWDVPDDMETYSEGDFPGIFCHNHLYFSTSPKKSNWLEDCNDSTHDGSGTPLSDDDCMSLQEAAFGTETLRRVEKIHSNIDPLRMFQTSDGPGYAEEEGADTSNAGLCLTVIISCFISLFTTLFLI